METTNGKVEITLSPSTTYDIVMVDQNSLSLYTDSMTTDANGLLVINLPEQYTKYSGWFSLGVFDNGTQVYFDGVTSVRPYVPIKTIMDRYGDKITSEQATDYERIVRQFIDSIIGYSFQFVRKSLHEIGNGTDFIPTHERITKIYSITENNEPLWSSGEDYPYEPFVDLHTIVRNPGSDTNNRLEYTVSYKTEYAMPIFIDGFDYVIDADTGWEVVPQSIQDAVLLLINDIICGTNKYLNKYIQSITLADTQFKYWDEAMYGTGNLIANNLIDPYIHESIRVRAI